MTTLIMPMAGRGSRFVEDDYVIPKPFLPVNVDYMFVEATKCLPETKRKLYVCLKQHEKIVRSADHDATVITVDNTTEGQASTCLIGLEHVDPEESILISACDHGLRYDYSKYLAIDADIIVWTVCGNESTTSNPKAYSWAVTESDNVIRMIVKELPLTALDNACVGTFWFKHARYFSENSQTERVNGEYYVESVIGKCVDAGLVVKVFQVDEYICWGTPSDYLRNALSDNLGYSK